MINNNIYQRLILIRAAKKRDGIILPCGNAKNLISDANFKMYEGRLSFWYNLPGGTTHMIMTEQKIE
jgi:hypothetical protein